MVQKEQTGLVTFLRQPERIRQRCHRIFDEVSAGKGLHFRFHPEKMSDLVNYVLGEMKQNYPDGSVPYHSRFRHFEAGGKDRVAELEKKVKCDSREWGQILFEWVVISVLTDAGAGPAWSWKDPQSGVIYKRSEGLAVAGTDWFLRGGLSSDPGNPYRVDRSVLINLPEEDLGRAFQQSEDNPLAGLPGRVEILRRLGSVLPEPEAGSDTRLGVLWNEITALSEPGKKQTEAGAVLKYVLSRLSPIWPDGLHLQGENVGDVGRHSLLSDLTPGAGLVPFHKLSQWLTYSVLEIFERTGFRVLGLNCMTGLPEYRNGGLLLDLGVLSPVYAESLEQVHGAGSEYITEWRALTVAVLDKLGGEICKKLGKSQEELPLVKILQGGTWSAGRRIAKEKREGGGPPLHIESTGTVF